MARAVQDHGPFDPHAPRKLYVGPPPTAAPTASLSCRNATARRITPVMANDTGGLS